MASLQVVLDPLQQALASGCHLTRNTLKAITEDVTFENKTVAPRFTKYKYDEVCIYRKGRKHSPSKLYI